MKSLSEVFPRASKAFLDANPHPPVPTVAEAQKNALQVNSVPNGGRVVHSTGFDMVPFGRKGMNKTEAEFAMILEAMKRRGEILRYEFEGITLRFATVKYTPDFVVFPCASPQFTHPLKLIEVKGPFCKGKFERAVERFRHAKTYYGDVFSFELHQKTKNGWQQII